MRIDLNADLGESTSIETVSNDAEIMKYISSANIACGFHAGDPLMMAKTVQLALENKVAIGVHPSYPDLEGFGRRSIKMNDDELFAIILYQGGALKSITTALGGKVNHVKPHGALYNDIANNYQKAKIVSEAIYKIDPELIFVGLANSQMLKAANETGLRIASEVFADRTYLDDGSLVPRTQEGAVIHDITKCINQINQILTENTVQTINGKTIPMHADTICVHGDNAQALDFVKALNAFFQQKGIELKSL